MHFWKFHGNGNDFVMIDNRKGDFDDNFNHIRKLCDRHFGIGADGLITLGASKEYDFSMQYYNADGKEGTMCGNGGRCIIAFAHMLHVLNEQKTIFRAIDGIHQGKVLHNSENKWNIALQMNNVENASERFNDTGSPHHIEFVSNLPETDVFSQGKAIRNSPEYKNIGGVNVNFLEERNGILNIRTYERGVENETLSCGTGSVAAALAYAMKNNIQNGPVEIKTMGGSLQIDFKRTNQQFSDIWIYGPAIKVFEGNITG
ncbi:MAG: diaminopimelate epimerase [Bacteroidales bacterium]|nr:diaminopimelate epimerase [Bacteroidales bacterium]MCF8326841.1 diaminopimelate epimerase [Bacteroidales bacterium]